MSFFLFLKRSKKLQSKLYIYENLRKISRNELRTVKGGLENNCHCSPGDSGKPPRDSYALDSASCFASCERYRNG